MSSYYRILIGGLDPLVSTFLTASGITNATYSNALDTLVKDLRANNFLTKIKCWHIYYGNLTKSKFNIINPIDSDANYRLNYFGTDTINDNGYNLSGTNSYANTHFIPLGFLSTDNCGITLISGTNNTPVKSDSFEIGGFVRLYLAIRNVNRFFGSAGRNPANTANFDARGIFTSTRATPSTFSNIKNGVVQVITSNPTASFVNEKITVGNIIISGTVYANGYSNQRIQQTLIHEGFTDAETATLHTLLSTFENSLGRKTW